MEGAAANVYRYFRQRGLSPAQAAGIVGNTQQESGSNPNAAGGGLIQGQGGRTSSGTLQQQLEGVWRELQGPERGTLGALKGAKDAKTAARIFSQRFERPGIPMLSKREQYALQALREFGGMNPGQGSPAASPGAPGASPAASGPAQQEGGAQAGQQLAQLFAMLTGQQQQSAAVRDVSSVSLPKPATAGGAPQAEGPKVPRDLGNPNAKASDQQAQLLQALTAIGGEQLSEPQPQSSGAAPASGYAPAGAAVHAGGPLAGLLPAHAMLKIGRIDAGQDGQTNPGGPIIANGHGEVVAVKSDPGGFGPSYPVVVFHDGPLAKLGPIYLGHTLAQLRPGAKFSPGQVLSKTGTKGVGNATTPGWFEIGLASALGQGNQGQGSRIAPYLTGHR